MVSALITVLLFPKVIAITAFSILILADSAAALVGRAIGKPAFGDKSPEGTLAFLVVSTAIAFFIQSLYSLDTVFLWSALAGGLIAALLEAASPFLKLDDNFTIPLSAATVMLVVQHLLG
jgi:dolichol kinase